MKAFGFKHVLSHVLLTALAFNLAGCDVSARLDDSLAQSQHVKDPYEAHRMLNAAYDDYYVHGCMWLGCTPKEHDHALRLDKASDQLLVKAVKAGDVRAINELFDKPSSTLAKEQAAPWVIGMAEKLDAPAHVLVIAGNLVMEGDYSPPDFRQAFGYFARAWQQGDPDATDRELALFTRMGDAANSYLWSLRCAEKCQWVDPDLQAQLKPEQKLDIERSARNNMLIVGPIHFRTIET